MCKYLVSDMIKASVVPCLRTFKVSAILTTMIAKKCKG